MEGSNTMQTANDIRAEFELDSDASRIDSPGKFEGEPLYVPALWDAGLSGEADEDFYWDEDACYAFRFTADSADPLRVAFPGLIPEGEGCFILYETEQGFVQCLHRTLPDLAAALNPPEPESEIRPSEELGDKMRHYFKSLD